MSDDATDEAIKAHIWALRNPARNAYKPQQMPGNHLNRWLLTLLIVGTLAAIYLAVR